MAIGNGLILGGGLSAGASNFLQAYMSVAQQAHAEKMQQNAGLINIIMDRMKDENTPLRDRARMMDMIPGLLGIKKMKRRLSHELGLTPDFLNSQEVVTPGTPGTEGTNDQGFAGNTTPITNTIDPNVSQNVSPTVAAATTQTPSTVAQADDSDVIRTNSNQSSATPITNNNVTAPSPTIVKLTAQQMADNLRNKMSGITSEGTPASAALIRGTEATPDVPAITMARGDLTPYLIKRGQTRQEAAEDWKMKQEQLIFANNLAKENAKAEGFTIHLSDNYDPKTGQRSVTMANATGEVKQYPVPGESEAMARARINSGKLSKTVEERKLFWRNKINPQTQDFYTDDEADILALNDANTVWQAKLSGTQANTARNLAAVNAVTPIQPAQAAQQQLAIADKIATLTGTLRTASRQLVEAGTLAKSTAQAAADHYKNVVQPVKDEINAYYQQIGQNPESPRTDQMTTDQIAHLDKLNKKLSIATAAYAPKEAAMNKAASDFAGLKQTHQAAQDQLDTYQEQIKGLGVTGVPQGVQNTPVGGLQVISQRPDVKAKLKQYRDLHPEDKRNDLTVIQGMIAHKIITP